MQAWYNVGAKQPQQHCMDGSVGLDAAADCSAVVDKKFCIIRFGRFVKENIGMQLEAVVCCSIFKCISLNEKGEFIKIKTAKKIHSTTDFLIINTIYNYVPQWDFSMCNIVHGEIDLATDILQKKLVLRLAITDRPLSKSAVYITNSEPEH